MQTSTVSTAAAATSDPARLAKEIEQEKSETALSDFNDFLTLLTAQMKNQDPLKPIDSTQFVEQLASFAAVEQQVGSNKKLSTLIEQGQSEQIGALAAWVGRNVDATKAYHKLGEDGLTVDVPEIPGASSVEAVISDQDGKEIMRLPVKETGAAFTWDGSLGESGRASQGLYAVAFEAEFDGQTPSRFDAAASGTVVEARLDQDGEPLLLLASGATARLTDVEAVGLAKPGSTDD